MLSRLNVGSQLGPYEIKAPIGSGGMGEVYKAKHRELGRWVAIKVLPKELASNPLHNKRLQREARAASRLNHPYICTFYDFCHEAEWSFIVMEYLEGETLSSLLERTRIGRKDVLRYAAEIAEGLAHAHANGLVHRDLKPGNIMITPNGAKILDFGLAKAVSLPARPDSSRLHDATTNANLTPERVVVGTLPYVAPEQLEHRRADARTDVFAFGVVLYEMITGRRPFHGSSEISLAVAILQEEPAHISSVAPETPSTLVRVVDKCLAKNPDDRWQSTRDLASELRWIAQSKSTQKSPGLVREKRVRVAWGVAVLVALISLSSLLLRNSEDSTDARTPVTFSLHPPPDVVFTEGSRNVVAVSPNGSRIAFVGTDPQGRTSIWMRTLDHLGRERLSGTEHAASPFWSPDSRSVGFFANRTLKIVPLGGGPPLSLAPAPEPRGGSWSRKGVILFAPRPRGGLSRVSMSGEVEVVTETDSSRAEIAHLWPQFLPDDDTFLYFVASNDTSVRGIYAGSLSGKRKQKIIKSSASGVYSNRYLLYLRGGSLLAQPFDPDTLELGGTPALIASSVASTWTLRSAVSSSDNGVLAFWSGNTKDQTRLVWLDMAGQVAGTITAPQHQRNPALSRNSQLAAVEAYQESDSYIRVVDLQNEATTRVALTDANARFPVWSADGRRLFFASNPLGPWDLYYKDMNRTSAPILLMSSEFDKMPVDSSPDGKLLAFAEQGIRGDYDISLMPLSEAGEPEPLLDTGHNEVNLRFSPSGRYIAYLSDASGRYEVYVQPFPATGLICQISSSGGYDPFWGADDHIVYFLNPRGHVLKATTDYGSECGHSSVVELFKSTIETPGTARNHYAVDRNGERLLMNSLATDPASNTITVVLDWPLEMRGTSN